MPRGRKPKSGLEYWQENCNNCQHFIKTHYLFSSKDNGNVSYKCGLSGEEVTPWQVDGCKKYEYGEITHIYKEVETKKDGNEQKD